MEPISNNTAKRSFSLEATHFQDPLFEIGEELTETTGKLFKTVHKKSILEKKLDPKELFLMQQNANLKKEKFRTTHNLTIIPNPELVTIDQMRAMRSPDQTPKSVHHWVPGHLDFHAASRRFDRQTTAEKIKSYNERKAQIFKDIKLKSCKQK